jgi:predicted transcriptional regulator
MYQEIKAPVNDRYLFNVTDRRSHDIINASHAKTYSAIFTGIFDMASYYKDHLCYATYYFRQDGSSMDLNALYEEFHTTNSSVDRFLQLLLKQGIISVRMMNMHMGAKLHSIVEPLLNATIYTNVINSIEHTMERYFLEFEEQSGKNGSNTLTIVPKIVKDKQRRDLLSPPSFSHQKDSMGAYNEGPWHYESITYGSAIVELRNIRHTVLRGTRNFFLSAVDRLVDDATTLFTAIQSFMNEPLMESTFTSYQ